MQKYAYGRWGRHLDDNHKENNSQDQVVDGNVEAEKRPQPKKRAEPKKKVEPKRATKKVATKEPKKTAKNSGGNLLPAKVRGGGDAPEGEERAAEREQPLRGAQGHPPGGRAERERQLAAGS